MAAGELSAVEAVEEVARGMALDLMGMVRETGLDAVTVSANNTGGVPSLCWLGLRAGQTVFRTCLAGEEVPES